ncbi:MAG: AtpZ/AtpI family protein [Bacteroidales bacterium]|nr:AtpZ/AtpI family protein [Bacteroidales bacterium]
MQNAKKQSPPNNLDKEKKALRDYARYSNLAFKLISIVLLPFIIGWQLDKWINTGFPLFTLIFSIGGLSAMLYILVKEK